MIYDGKNEFDARKSQERLKWLIAQGKRFELTEKRQKRSLNQNNYLHVILTYYALEMGEEMEYVKQYILKEIVCPHIFKYERINHKTGEARTAYKSTADLNTKQMTDAIDCFRNHSAKELGLYLPEPSDLSLIEQMERVISQNQQYL